MDLQLARAVEVIGNALRAGTGDKDDVLDAGLHCFLDEVLDDGAIHQWDQLLGQHLGGRQEAGAETGDGKDCLLDFHDEPHFRSGQGALGESRSPSMQWYHTNLRTRLTPSQAELNEEDIWFRFPGEGSPLLLTALRPQGPAPDDQPPKNAAAIMYGTDLPVPPPSSPGRGRRLAGVNPAAVARR